MKEPISPNQREITCQHNIPVSTCEEHWPKFQVETSTSQDILEGALSTYFVEYKAARLPAEMDLAVNKALASLTVLLQKKYQEGELNGRIDELSRIRNTKDRAIAYDTIVYVKERTEELKSQLEKEEPKRLFGMKVETDPKVPSDSVRFDHPDGRSEGFILSEEEQ